MADSDTQNQIATSEYREVNGKQIHIIHVADFSRQGVDEYIQIVKDEILAMEGNLLLSIHNYAKLGGIITPYFLGRAKQLAAENQRTDMVGRVGMVTTMDIFRILMNPLMKIFARENNKVTIKFFTSLDEAIQWVSEYEI